MNGRSLQDSRRSLLAWALVLLNLLASVPALAALPPDSLFHVNPALEAANGRKTTFAATGGHVQIVTMFYASCPMACPLIIDTLRNIDRALPAAGRSKLGILMLSIDPERDTPAALNALAVERRITDPRWVLARATPSDTRALAAALGIQYRALGNGDFDHSSTMVLLDSEGRVLARSSKLGTPDAEFLAAIRKALGAESTAATGEGDTTSGAATTAAVKSGRAR
jgi:protein SCO1